MNGICGWSLASGQHIPASGTLEAMISRLAAAGESAGSKAVTPAASLAGTGISSVYSDRNLLVACAGEPRFSDTQANLVGDTDCAANRIASLYQRYGHNFLEKIHGTFSIALTDIDEQVTLLAVDRAGICPLYYSVTSHGLIYASSLGSLGKHPDIDRTIDPQSLYDYLYYHMVPSPRSIYVGQQKLLPAELVSYSRGTLTRRFYWRVSYSDDSAAGFAALKEEFRSVLTESVSRSASIAETGAFLSGGTDSSTVAGTLSRLQDSTTRTYSIGFDAPGFDETYYARIAAAHFGTEHHEYYLTPQDVVTAIPRIASAYDEPFGNASAVPTYYCARLAHDTGTRLMLAGDGGDELFAGNARYVTQKMFEAYGRIPPGLRRHLIEPVAFGMPGGERIPPLRKLQSYIRQARVPLPVRLENYNFMHHTPISQILSEDFIGQIDPEEAIGIMNDAYNRADTQSYLNRMLHLDLKNTLADNDLRKVTRMCELAGVSVHYPLLDEEMIAFSARVPVDLKLKRLRLRYFFKESLRDFLPREIIHKSKHGFGLPFGIWLSEKPALQELAYDSIRSLQQRGYFRSGYIDYIIRKHQTEHATYYGTMLWILMMLEQWLSAHAD